MRYRPEEMHNLFEALTKSQVLSQLKSRILKFKNGKGDVIGDIKKIKEVAKGYVKYKLPNYENVMVNMEAAVDMMDSGEGYEKNVEEQVRSAIYFMLKGAKLIETLSTHDLASYAGNPVNKDDLRSAAFGYAIVDKQDITREQITEIVNKVFEKATADKISIIEARQEVINSIKKLNEEDDTPATDDTQTKDTTKEEPAVDDTNDEDDIEFDDSDFNPESLLSIQDDIVSAATDAIDDSNEDEDAEFIASVQSDLDSLDSVEEDEARADILISLLVKLADIDTDDTDDIDEEVISGPEVWVGWVKGHTDHKKAATVIKDVLSRYGDAIQIGDVEEYIEAGETYNFVGFRTPTDFPDISKVKEIIRSRVNLAYGEREKHLFIEDSKKKLVYQWSVEPVNEANGEQLTKIKNAIDSFNNEAKGIRLDVEPRISEHEKGTLSIDIYGPTISKSEVNKTVEVLKKLVKEVFPNSVFDQVMDDGDEDYPNYAMWGIEGPRKRMSRDDFWKMYSKIHKSEPVNEANDSASVRAYIDVDAGNITVTDLSEFLSNGGKVPKERSNMRIIKLEPGKYNAEIFIPQSHHGKVTNSGTVHVTSGKVCISDACYFWSDDQTGSWQKFLDKTNYLEKLEKGFTTDTGGDGKFFCTVDFKKIA